MSYTYFFDIFISYTYEFWVIYVLYLSRAAPLRNTKYTNTNTLIQIH